MKRLFELQEGELEQWRQKRKQIGREKYGDSHLKRYGLVDMEEELLDCFNIYELFLERLKKQNFRFSETFTPDLLEIIADSINNLADMIVDLDKELDDIVCTDEQGGDRIWWNEETK